MRHSQKVLQEAEFMHEFEGGRMYGVTPEIAKEIAVLFEDGDRYTRAGQKISQHDSRRSSSHNAAGCFQSGSGHSIPPLQGAKCTPTEGERGPLVLLSA